MGKTTFAVTVIAAASLAVPLFMARPALCQPAEGPPGVDLSALDSAGRDLFFRIAEEQFCPCGRSQSFKDTLYKPAGCEVATKLGNYVALQIAEGKPKKEVVRGLLRSIANINARFEFDLGGSPRTGAADARIVVVEFSDFECPYCQKISKPVVELSRKHKDVAVVYKFYPLSFHKHARRAAQAAVAAHRQGRFWEMHDLIFDSQEDLSEVRLVELARKLKLDVERFKKDMDSAETHARIESDRTEGDKAGIAGTPTLFVNGLLVDDFYQLEQAIEEARKL